MNQARKIRRSIGRRLERKWLRHKNSHKHALQKARDGVLK